MLPFQQMPRLLLLLQTLHLLPLLVQASTLRELATAGGSNDFDSQLTAGNPQQTQQMLLSKRAFDRLDVSPFDFTKRFFDQEETPLAKLFTRPSMLTQPKGRRIRQRPSSSSSLSSAPARRRMARVHGFGLFGPAKFKRRAEPVVERQTEPQEVEEDEHILILY